MDRFQSMAVCVATVDKGSLSAATEAFGISPPIAGKHIRQLKERVGTRLLMCTMRRGKLRGLAQHRARMPTLVKMAASAAGVRHGPFRI